MQAAVRWPKQERGKKASWMHVQFESEESVEAACQLSGQQMMGREVMVERASASSMTEKPLNMGQAVKDCWFCLSNDQVLIYTCTRMRVCVNARMVFRPFPLSPCVNGDMCTVCEVTGSLKHASRRGVGAVEVDLPHTSHSLTAWPSYPRTARAAMFCRRTCSWW